MKSALAYSPRRFHSTSSSTEAKGTLARRPSIKRYQEARDSAFGIAGKSTPKRRKARKTPLYWSCPGIGSVFVTCRSDKEDKGERDGVCSGPSPTETAPQHRPAERRKPPVYPAARTPPVGLAYNRLPTQPASGVKVPMRRLSPIAPQTWRAGHVPGACGTACSGKSPESGRPAPCCSGN